MRRINPLHAICSFALPERAADDIPRRSDHDQDKNADQFARTRRREVLQHGDEVVRKMHENGKEQVPFPLVKDPRGDAH